MRAIKVDALTKQVYEVNINEADQLKSLQSLVGCDTIDIVSLTNSRGIDLVIDDEGLCHDPKPDGFCFVPGFARHPGPFAGNGLLVSHDLEGELKDLLPILTVEDVQRNVQWFAGAGLPEPSLEFYPMP